MLFEGKGCKIGQKERCEATGCEWKKVFNQNCLLLQPEVNVKLNFVPAEDTKPFYPRRIKKGRVVKDEKKYTEVKNIVPKVQNSKEEENFINKISTPSQDDWIKKIKTI